MSFFISVIVMGFVPSLGFSILFHVPKRLIFPAMAVGFCSNAAYQAVIHTSDNKMMACFLGACVVGFFAYFMARGLHEASTVFILPGIMPLVPGSYMYYTMSFLIERSYSQAASSLSSTLLMAGSVALGLLISGSILKICTSLKRKVQSFYE